MNISIKNKLETLPEAPGSYQMLDSGNNIIYVGKAKNLRNRVKSYFTGSHDLKTQTLVSNIVDFNYIVTSSELEAFLLELALIKEHQPRFNIMLTDDKTYPYIEITNEKYPRLVITRKISKKSKNVFGPFPDAFSARETLQLLNRIFPFRKCVKMPKKVCLYYHIGQCLGPCEYAVEPQIYEDMIQKVKKFMTGHNQDLIRELEMKMQHHSQNLEYEKAKEYKDLLNAVDRTTQKQKIIFNDLRNRDIINYHVYDNYMCIAILFMRQGKIIFSEADIVTFYSTQEEAFIDYLAQFYDRHLVPEEVVLPDAMDYSLLNQVLNNRQFVPQRGKKLQLLEMARQNAEIQLQNNLQTYLRKHEKTIGALEKLGDLIGIDTPTRIEAFDNSNTMGANPVSALVVFTNGLADRKNYRKFKVKSVSQPDDYNTMKEIIYRRYQRLLMEAGKMPDLIVMDGGLIQVRAAREVLASLSLSVPVIGLKKDSKHKTDVLIGLDDQEYKLDRHDPLYILLNKIQEEAHRFAITFHRDKQQKQIYASILDAIPKIGSVTKTKLLQKYKTLDNIRNAKDDALRSDGLTLEQIANLRIALGEAK
ncbi:MAG: excinuclease ABC subunit UvrC [Bacilli bacterium]|nr:excinuclease ABC subunit UvrC [Bacilli bacterium]MBN2696296.1 excinuclease ABC subunit UvrC [Bacilli bacterium]